MNEIEWDEMEWEQWNRNDTKEWNGINDMELYGMQWDGIQNENGIE